MTVDERVPGYLGRVLDGSGSPVGTCFQVRKGVLATAWHVLNDLGAGYVDAVVTVDALEREVTAGPARVAQIDQDHDLAVLVTKVELPAVVAGLAMSDAVPLSTSVAITGVTKVDDGNSEYPWLTAPGEWKVGTSRDGIRLSRLTAPDVQRGMSGAPVLRTSDDKVIGVVSGRYNTGDGWLPHSVWAARVEALLPLLDELTESNNPVTAWLRKLGPAGTKTLSRIFAITSAISAIGRFVSSYTHNGLQNLAILSIIAGVLAALALGTSRISYRMRPEATSYWAALISMVTVVLLVSGVVEALAGRFATRPALMSHAKGATPGSQGNSFGQPNPSGQPSSSSSSNDSHSSPALDATSGVSDHNVRQSTDGTHIPFIKEPAGWWVDLDSTPPDWDAEYDEDDATRDLQFDDHALTTNTDTDIKAGRATNDHRAIAATPGPASYATCAGIPKARWTNTIKFGTGHNLTACVRTEKDRFAFVTFTGWSTDSPAEMTIKVVVWE